MGNLLPRLLILGLASAAGCGASAESITGPELAKQLEAGTAPVVVDVRSADEFAEGHVPGAIHIPFSEIGESAGEIPTGPGEPVVLYCEHGPRAVWARWSLGRQDFERVITLEGHMSGWRKAGLPIETLSTEDQD